MKLPTSLEETVQLPVVPELDRPAAEPVIDQPVHGELPKEPGAHRQATPMSKGKQIALGAAALVVLSVGGVVLFGSGPKSDEPAAGPSQPAVVAPPTSSTAEPAAPAATETLAVPTTKPVASAQVRAEEKTTTTPPPASKETKTSESVDPTAAALSSFMREFEEKYGKPPHSRR